MCLCIWEPFFCSLNVEIVQRRMSEQTSFSWLGQLVSITRLGTWINRAKVQSHSHYTSYSKLKHSMQCKTSAAIWRFSRYDISSFLPKERHILNQILLVLQYVLHVSRMHVSGFFLQLLRLKLSEWRQHLSFYLVFGNSDGANRMKRTVWCIAYCLQLWWIMINQKKNFFAKGASS